MEDPKVIRESASAISIDTNVRCLRLYPIEDTKRDIANLKSIGIMLNKEQAICRVLLAVTQEWEEIDITGYRFEQRKQDGTYRLTITSRAI